MTQTESMGKNWFLQQDNARPHTSKITKAEIQKLKINLLPYWPPYSPDLSPIEVIWAIMKRRIEKHKPRTLDELVEIIKYVWEINLTYATINLLMNSFPLKLLKCISNQGGEVRYQQQLVL